MTADLKSALHDIRSEASRLVELLDGAALPAILAARTLIVLDKMRSDLAGTVQAVAHAQQSRQSSDGAAAVSRDK